MNGSGVRFEGADHFDDLLEAEEAVGNGGILESQGLRDYDNIKTSVKREGGVVRMNCRHCNKPREVTMEWTELMQVAGNQQNARPFLPQGWQFSENNGTAYVALQCPNCGNPEGFAVHTTPEEAHKLVQQGINAGFVNPSQAQQIAQQVQAVQARGAR